MTAVDLTGMMSKDEFLEHAGVKGMKWGKRSAAGPKMGPDGNPAKSRSELRGLDRATKGRDKLANKEAMAKRADGIQKSRDRLNSGEARRDLKAAKIQYKSDKQIVGKREARKALTAVRVKNVNDQANASEYKNGKEAVAGLAAAVLTAVVIAKIQNS